MFCDTLHTSNKAACMYLFVSILKIKSGYCYVNKSEYKNRYGFTHAPLNNVSMQRNIWYGDRKCHIVIIVCYIYMYTYIMHHEEIIFWVCLSLYLSVGTFGL